MSERSDPLGPPAEVFPVEEYKLVSPDMDEIVDTVRIEQLNFKTVPDQPSSDNGPKWFDATVLFAIDGVSWPLRLAYDVNFISAWPCSDGPHPLFFDYVHTPIKADAIVSVRNWGGLYEPRKGSNASRSHSVSPNSDNVAKSRPISTPAFDPDDDDRVLVIEAFGVRDNEVLARAWCSHWGLSAVIADIGRTWYVILSILSITNPPNKRL
jgi:hypothetical protein